MNLRFPLSRSHSRPLTLSLASALLLALALSAPRHAHGEEAQTQTQGPATIAHLDVARYLGRWYEIAKLPNRFQKDCVADTSAQYSLREDGRLKVINRCRRADGRFDEAEGTAKQIGASDSPKLKVRFAPAWLSFIPAVWGDYWVLDLDESYQLAAVGSPSREYLWVLSRSPQLQPAAYQALLARLKAQGFATDKLEMTPQLSQEARP